MTTISIRQTRRVSGAVHLPADKSIAHRAALLSALAEGASRIENYPASADPQSTLSCLRQLGVSIVERGGVLEVTGRGKQGLSAPAEPIDCGNSGTTMRLLAGILAGQPFDSELVGDASLSSRPMGRAADPLRQMGAHVELTDGHAPITIRGGRALKGITYPLPVPSAQIKSCVLLAGLYAGGETTVIETVPSRDHTERMLGLDTVEIGPERRLTISRAHQIPARTWIVPRDFSAAAFFLVAGSIAGEGRLVLPDVGLNPTRTALLDVLRAMGARIHVTEERVVGGEPIGTLTVLPSEMYGVRVGGALIPNLIDEIPVLAVAAAFARGRTEIRDAAELRVKETDRIAAMARNLETLGADVDVFDDGLAVTGGRTLIGATVDSYGDHRIAMAMAVAGLGADGETVIEGAECAAVSFPDFWEQLDAARG